MKELLRTVSDIFKDGLYKIPDYQRHYFWSIKQAEDLWNDIEDLASGKEHFMGTIIVKPDTKEEYKHEQRTIYEIVDGQQRLITSTLLIKAALDNLKNEGDDNTDEMVEEYDKNYLHYGGKLVLNPQSEDHHIFESLILTRDISKIAIVTYSNKRILDVYRYYQKRFSSGEKASTKKLLKKFLSCFKVLRYAVDSYEDAIRVFNVLNDRGLPLSNLDKTKSWAMYYLQRNVKDNAKIGETFRFIKSEFSDTLAAVNKLYQSDFSKESKDRIKPEFEEDNIQRYHFVVFDKKIGYRETEMFKYYSHVLNTLRNSKEDHLISFVKGYFSTLRKMFETLTDILTSANDIPIIENLLYLEGLAYAYPLSMAVWSKSGKEEKKMFLGVLEKLVFRVYMVGGRSARSDLFKLANDYFNSEIDFSSLITQLKKFAKNNQNDKIFQENLEKLGYRSKKTIRYLLYEYENHHRRLKKENAISLKNIEGYTIEHIIAQKYAKDSQIAKSSICGFENELEAREYINRIGNLTLTPHSWNACWQDADYKDKVTCGRCKQVPDACYERSSLWIQRELPLDYGKDRFCQSEVDRRTETIVNFALERWKI